MRWKFAIPVFAVLAAGLAGLAYFPGGLHRRGAGAADPASGVPGEKAGPSDPDTNSSRRIRKGSPESTSEKLRRSVGKVPDSGGSKQDPESSATGRDGNPHLADSSDPGGSGAPPRAIRLADAFRLPAVLLERAAEEDGGQQVAQPTVAPLPLRVAKEDLVTDFYRKIASAATGAETGKIPAEEGDANLGTGSSRGAADTGADAGQMAPEAGEIVIEAGGEADRIRREIDERYRILHGDEAFNRRSLDSAIEVTLPPLEAGE